MGIFGKKKSDAEKNQEIYEKERLKREEELLEKEEGRLDEILSKIIIFPGNKQEFEELMGYECSIIDTGSKNKIVYCEEIEENIFSFDSYELHFKKMLVDKGIIALIHSSYEDYREELMGLPVRRK